MKSIFTLSLLVTIHFFLSAYSVEAQANVMGRVESVTLNLNSSFSSPFVVPPRLRARVNFWKDIFTKYGRHYVVIHHRNFPQITFDIVDLSVEGALLGDIAFDNLKKTRVDKAVKAVKFAIQKLSTGGSASTRLERNIKQSMEQYLGSGNTKYSLVLKDDLIRTQTGIREKFKDSVKRSGKYLKRMEEIFKGYGLPPELTRLPFIESSFDYTAYSSVGAAGIWQFMRRTALNYMTINRVVDQRRDPIIATHAAAKYLREAYQALGNWPQAVTSYNHGVGGVRRKMNVAGLSSLADMIEHPRLNTFGFASSNFYPEFLAAVEIYRDYKKYFPGLVVDLEQKYVERRLAKSMSIQSVARVYGYSIDSLKSVNYSFTSNVWNGRQLLPTGYTVKFPVGAGSEISQVAIVRSPAEESPKSVINNTTAVKYRSVTPVKAPKEQLYIVRKGDSLSTIARKYGSTVSVLLAANNMRSASRLIVGQRLRIPSTVKVAASSRQTASPQSKVAPAYGRYTIQRGDNVGMIAERFNISVQQLRSLNGLSTNRIFVGQVLRVPTGRSGGFTSRSVKPAPQYHLVVSGDSLWSISRRYGVSQKQIMLLNGAKARSLMKGQRIRIK
jgi:membrane-bound lytic murein transglycosylase D